MFTMKSTESGSKPDFDEIALPALAYGEPIAEEYLDQVTGGFNPQPDPPGKARPQS